ncbi:hypothetical protein D9611_002090 [Ephemerocybe angulata]|uniref:CxC2-like cysteine cluster KDZ transposase-associated domain-containing protein n=1 Tax=Ephemerocybe angulata TaxID=980116 RepID=A0A8H5CKA3_9AGAR|nr:hypothetical protein D9611_002090 [Tulosesus angulatus]
MPPKKSFDRRGFKVSDLVVQPSKRGDKLKLVPVTRARLSSLIPRGPKNVAVKRPRTDDYNPHKHRMEPELGGFDYGSDDSGAENAAEAAKQEYKEDLFTRHSGKTSQGNTTHEYMKLWKESKVGLYLAEIIEAEALRSSDCERCLKGATVWRCLTCVGTPRLCRECCLVGHRDNPLHRVERWTAGHWVPAWLWHVGTIICLGHGSQPCPRYQATREDLEARCTNINEVDDFSDDPSYGAIPKNKIIGSGDVVAFVHTNGYHHLPVFSCFCPNAPADEVQCLRHSFYPTTSKSVKTVFTFEVLKHVHLLKVQTHMATDSYSDILRRLTNYSFPAETLDRKRELGRIWQQFNHLTNLKRNGFGVSPDVGEPQEGELALFCATCPQPDINLPENWKVIGPMWKYNRYLVSDGNFVLNHPIKQGSEEGVDLTEGRAFMTEKTAYGQHVKSSKEYKEAPMCNKHRAIAEKNQAKKGYDSTGLVAVACARHGCFAPGAVVDMQKGERQLNVDYALCQALKSTNAKALPKSILAPRLQELFPKNLVLDFLIGLFHVHGHKEECLHRFAPTYYPGAGVKSGEILESLWSTLNGAASSTRNMTLPHRSEMLDACMNDGNWRKLQGMVAYLITSLDDSKVDQAQAAEDFRKLDSTASEAQRASWTTLMNKANQDRSAPDGNASMDVYNMNVPKPEAPHAIQVRMMEEEKAEKRDQVGVADWISLGIELQEAQIKQRALLRSRPLDLPTTRKKKANKALLKREVETARKAQAIIRLMNIFYTEAEDLFPDVKLEDMRPKVWGIEEEVCICEDECICEEEDVARTAELLRGSEHELSPLPLPSSLEERPDGWDVVFQKEEILRVAQADDALEELRNHIVQKSRLYRENKKLASGKRERTRGYDAINEVERSMRYQVQRYRSALWALERLDVAEKYPQFQVLTRAHTTAVSSVYDPNKAGARDEALSWIWHLNVEGDSDNSKYMEEVYRISWIRAKSRSDRWTEEVALLKSEMDWFVRFTHFRQTRAEGWALRAETDGSRSYASRQADMWRRVGADAVVKFRTKAGVDLLVMEDSVKQEVKEEGRIPGDPHDSDGDEKMDIDEAFKTETLDVKSAFYNFRIRALKPRVFQSLINYASSRCRAAALCYGIRHTMISDDALSMYKSYLLTELISTNYLFGMGLTVHDERLHPPWAFRGLLRLFVEGREGEFDAIMAIVTDRRDEYDQVLAKYEGNWWISYTPDGPQVAPTSSPLNLLDHWQKQLKDLPPAVCLPRYSNLNLGALTEAQLTGALAASSDAIRFIDSDIEMTRDHLKGLALTIKALRDLSQRIMKLEVDELVKRAELISRS